MRRVDIPLVDPPQQLVRLDVENVQLHAHALRSRAQAQRVALLPTPQAEIEDAAAPGGQQLEGELD